MAYPTTAALVSASDEESLNGLSDSEKETVRLLAIKAIEQFCNQTFEEDERERILAGSGGHVLSLDKRLASITTISVDGSSIDAGDVEFNDRHSTLTVARAALGSNWVERTLREDVPPVFTAGAGVVTIDGVWGWLDTEIGADDLDHPVNVAIRLDMEDQALHRSGPLADASRAMAKARSDFLQEGPLSLRTSRAVLPISSEVQTLLSDEFVWEPVGAVA